MICVQVTVSGHCNCFRLCEPCMVCESVQCTLGMVCVLVHVRWTLSARRLVYTGFGLPTSLYTLGSGLSTLDLVRAVASVH